VRQGLVLPLQILTWSRKLPYQRRPTRVQSATVLQVCLSLSHCGKPNSEAMRHNMRYDNLSSYIRCLLSDAFQPAFIDETWPTLGPHCTWPTAFYIMPSHPSDSAPTNPCFVTVVGLNPIYGLFSVLFAVELPLLKTKWTWSNEAPQYHSTCAADHGVHCLLDNDPKVCFKRENKARCFGN
jgi:hypothetical protein